MGNRVWRKWASTLLVPVLLLIVGQAQAVSLEKIEVASHLGEPFFAEVPLRLDANEQASKIAVEIAAPADYKIFEVYRDPAVQAIRADVTSDKRGVRVVLSSRSRIQSPFFNLVLKVRYGRVARFKKFPVFLDTPKAIGEIVAKAPQPAVKAVEPAAKAAVKQPVTATAKAAAQLIASAGHAVAEPAAAGESAPNAYAGWARTGRYGPIVHGDTLSTVAERLRIDYRYTRNQIMMALFEKNSDSFDQNNINLLKAGSYLQVPTAAEVEQHSKEEAIRFLAEQERQWKQLTHQPRYAAEAEAQRTRYSKRISVGDHADGVAAAPVAMADAGDALAAQPAATDQSGSAASETDSAAPADAAGADATAADSGRIDQIAEAQQESGRILEELRQQNTLLQEQLASNQQRIEALNQKLEGDAATAAASKAQLEKLELLITRLQSQLDQVAQQRPAEQGGAMMDWVVWLLIALVVILLVIVAMLMRREPAHPAEAAPQNAQDETAAAAPQADEDAADQSKTLERVIEHEVADIETGETEIPAGRETATIDSLPVFNDELSDTDTAELEPFDADADSEPDPDIDYLAEADVYIRYGMDDEAIKQLDMALRLQPDNVEAHIKKAELLLGKSDRPALDETIAVATMTLAAEDLARFRASIEELGAETEPGLIASGAHPAAADESVAADIAGPADVGQGPETVPLDEAAADDLNFDLSDLDVPDIEQDRQQEEQEVAAGVQAEEDLSWLHDENFDDAASAAPAEESTEETDDLESSPTQVLDHLLGEFPDDETRRIEISPETSSADSDDDIAPADLQIDEQDQAAAGATRRLDQLLSEFDDDEDPIDLITTQDGLDASLGAQTAEPATATVGTDHGATQELDSLLAEFSDDDDALLIGGDTAELDVSFFDADRKAESQGAPDERSIGLDTDHGATQELDSLLAEFSDTDEIDSLDLPGAAAGEEAAQDEHGATQVLGHLLDEFNDDIDEGKDQKKD